MSPWAEAVTNLSNCRTLADGDGHSKLVEFLTGTDPRAALSVLAITSVGFDGDGNVTVTFSAIAGRKYQLRTSEDLKIG